MVNARAKFSNSFSHLATDGTGLCSGYEKAQRLFVPKLQKSWYLCYFELGDPASGVWQEAVGFGRSDKGVHLQGGQDNFYVAWVFALELKLSKTLSGLVYSVLQL